MAVLAAVGVGLVSGGNVAGLSRLRIRWWPILLAAVALQWYTVGHWANEALAGVPVRAFIFVGTHALVLAVAAANLHLQGLAVVALGTAANLAALLANGGYMPVSPEAHAAIARNAAMDSLAAGAVVMGSKGIVVPAGQANLWFLTDVFVLPPPFPVPTVLSFGDLLVALGLGYLVVASMRQARGGTP